MIKTLTAKQLKFCHEYMTDLNATQASIRAGYAPRSANRIASRLLLKDDIKQKINELQQEQEQRTQITQDRVLQELASIGFAPLDKIKTGDKLKALELLGKHLGIFDKVEVNSDDAVIIIDDIPADYDNDSKALELHIPNNNRD